MWQYADWIQLEDLSARLTRLRLHITEVSQHIMGTSTRSRSVTAVQDNYLARLQDQEEKLARSVSRPSIARNKVEINNR